jgi:hypothetical protein
LFILPAFDVRTRDIGLQIRSVMMFCVPRTRWLVKAVQPQHSIGNELEAHLNSFEIAFVGSNVVLTEDAELMLSYTKDQIGTDPRVGIARVCLARAMKRFGSDEDLEFAGGVFVLRECRIGPGKTRDQA